MKAKTVVTAAVLAFVAVSVGYLVVKEVSADRAPGAKVGPSGGAAVATAERESGPGEAERSGPPGAAVSGAGAPNEGVTPSAAVRKVVVTYYYTSKR
jgi:hypothetical protein